MKTGSLQKPQSGSMIVETIIDAINAGELKPGDKLFGESELARRYSESVYSVRKAIQKLKASGYLYSIPKNGVFVSRDLPRHEQKKDVVSEEENLSGFTDYNAVKFSTGSFLPAQQEIFKKISDSFARTSLVSRIEFAYDRNRVSGVCIEGDLYEFSSQSPIYQGHQSLMDMKKYFTETVRFRDSMIDNTGIPLYFSVPIVLYNKNVLRALGFGEKPEFHDYDSMITCFDEITKAVACDPKYSMPGTSQNIIHKFGRCTGELFRDIRDFSLKEKQFRDKYHDMFQNVTGYWRKYHISYPCRTSEYVKNFTDEKTPFFFGFSSNYLSVREINPELNSGAAIMYSCDNTVNGIMGLLAVDTRSRNLLETIRVAQHFQEEEFQKDFARNGLFPMMPEYYPLMPYDNADSGLELSECISKEDYYIAMNIVNVELWNIVLFEKSIKDAIHDILVFARSYLKMDRDMVPTQNRWAELYR